MPLAMAWDSPMENVMPLMVTRDVEDGFPKPFIMIDPRGHDPVFVPVAALVRDPSKEILVPVIVDPALLSVKV